MIRTINGNSAKNSSIRPGGNGVVVAVVDVVVVMDQYEFKKGCVRANVRLCGCRLLWWLFLLVCGNWVCWQIRGL